MKKALWPLIGAILMGAFTAIQEAMADKQIGAQEWVLVAIAVVMAFNVWATANLPQYESMKTYVAALLAVLGALVSFIIGGVDVYEVINLIILGLSALGVAVAPQRNTTVVNGKTIPPTVPVPATSGGTPVA